MMVVFNPMRINLMGGELNTAQIIELLMRRFIQNNENHSQDHPLVLSLKGENVRRSFIGKAGYALHGEPQHTMYAHGSCFSECINIEPCGCSV